MLTTLTEYLAQHRRASLTELARAVNSTPEAVEGMLALLERKGRVRRLPAGSSCERPCCSCDPAAQTLYEWCGNLITTDRQQP